MAVMVGMSAHVSHTVSDADTAVALLSGTVEVLGTPRAIAWAEEATVLAVAPGLRDHEVCVGTRIGFEHLQPTVVGVEVTASAQVVSISGRIVTLEVELHRHDAEGDTLIAHGEIVRVVLARDRLLERAQSGLQ